MKVIAISGWKHSGKDTCADYLIKNHNFTRIGFADPLKDMVAKEYGVKREWLDDPQYKDLPLIGMPIESKDDFTRTIHNFMLGEFRTVGGYKPDKGYVRTENDYLETFIFDEWEKLYQTPRSLCILKGSVNRSVRSNYWVSKAIDSIKTSNLNNVVISDMRYKSEMQQLREAFENNLITIRINRFSNNPSQDPSETDLDNAKFDFIVENKGEKEEFFAQLQEIISKIQAS